MATLHVLIVDDSPDDVELMVQQLRRHFPDLQYQRVDTDAALQTALQQPWDAVISDYTMPGFSGLAALERFKASGQLVPFIVVTGTVGEESAVAMMKAGVDDFVLKGNMQRLPRILERELREMEVRRSRQRTELQLRESEERYALALQGANDGIWDWDLRQQTIYFSPRWKIMLGYSAEDFIDADPTTWRRLVHPDDIAKIEFKLIQHLRGESSHFEVEHRMQHRDGSWRWMLTRGLALRDTVSNEAYRMAGSLTDITDRKRAEEQLLHDALHDSLTGLANRVMFTDFLGFALGHGGRNPQYHCAVLCLNLERFRFVNDSYGYAVGDELLRITAHRLLEAKRPGDVVARFSGDEYAILLDDLASSDEATRCSETILQAINRPVLIQGHEFFPNARLGLALSASGYRDPVEMIRDADTAMHRAKRLNKSRLEVFDSAMHQNTVRALQLELDMRRAIEKEEFVAYYQPIIDLESGGISSFEALVRWQHPQEGLVSPAVFIPLAEEIGLINAIGQQMLRQACQQIRTWAEELPNLAPVGISVNLSSRQFLQPDLAEQVAQAIRLAAIEAKRLKLEITESILMENNEASVEILHRLRLAGIQIMMDDFGTGYSSLSYLHRFPSDVLKIDGSFIQRMDQDRGSIEIVKALVILAHNLGMVVVAEGVETAAQLALLRQFGCDFAQGYHMSRPLPAADATELLWRQPRW